MRHMSKSTRTLKAHSLSKAPAYLLQGRIVLLSDLLLDTLDELHEPPRRLSERWT